MAFEPDLPVSKLRNLGPASSRWLNDVGIFTAGELAHLGPVIAYRIIKESGYPASLNLLYALEAALQDIDWRRLEEATRERLRRDAGE